MGAEIAKQQNTPTGCGNNLLTLVADFGFFVVSDALLPSDAIHISMHI